MTSHFRNSAELAAFQEDVLVQLGARYQTEDGEVIEGNSFSFVQQALRGGFRGRRWTLAGGYGGFSDCLKETGFKVIRARTLRYTRKGELKPYAECDVVTL